MPNTDIRKEIKSAGLRHWQIARALGISENTFCRRLREELTPAGKSDVRTAIRQLQNGVSS